jgi:hypothetical protein
MLSLLFFLPSCSQWKVSSLSPKTILSLPAGAEPRQITLAINDSDIMDISFTVKVSHDRILVADNKAKRLQVFEMDGSPDLSIGKKGAAADSPVPFNFGIIGDTARDSEGRIYVQNRIDAGSPAPQGAVVTGPSQDDLEIVPSYILVFDSAGKLQYAMGQRGAADLPFYYIENITIDDKDRLFVVSKSLSSWNIFRFKNKVRDFYANIGKDSFREKEGQDEYSGIIENVVPYRSGEKLLVSVAYYHNTRFKFRKIHEYIVSENRLGRELFAIQDPKNELFSIMDDKYILLWDTEEKDVRFVIWGFDGNIVNNLKIANDRKKSYYREIISDEAGRFYSYSARKTVLEVSEWK